MHLIYTVSPWVRQITIIYVKIKLTNIAQSFIPNLDCNILKSETGWGHGLLPRGRWLKRHLGNTRNHRQHRFVHKIDILLHLNWLLSRLILQMITTMTLTSLIFRWAMLGYLMNSLISWLHQLKMFVIRLPGGGLINSSFLACPSWLLIISVFLVSPNWSTWSFRKVILQSSYFHCCWTCLFSRPAYSTFHLKPAFTSIN